MNRCDICLDEKCEKKDNKKNCNCENCLHKNECPKFLHATIRITTKCTQECSHCCFSCSPSCDKMMTIDMARKIAKFLKSNEILSLNVMGGEFFCNPDWFDILSILLEVVDFMRLVSNGDWATNDDVKTKLLKLKTLYDSKFYIAISNDSWHHNKNVESAKTFLEENYFKYVIGEEKQDNENAIVPIGRSEFSFGLYSMFACYCHEPSKQYTFLIDENGVIYKCSFGVWDYAKVDQYLDGGFAKRFKEFNKTFYKIFIPSCSSCIRCAKRDGRIYE
jgi:MoaA/NifB/PqqE/SkfB family radical SAM enzyme